jgi:hypothetical protein
VFPAVGGPQSTANSAAVLVGGGLNVNLKPHLALRAVEGDWLRTSFPNASIQAQHSFRLSTGLVFYF